jgi:DNA-binding PadR family transcriptional regulator
MDKLSIVRHVGAMSRPDPESFLPLKPDTVLVLLALASQPLHGYGIIQDVAERSSGGVRLQTGALYRLLRTLLLDGLVRETDRPRGAMGDDDRRRYYALTALGDAVLTAEVERMARLVRAARLVAQGKRPQLA